MSGNVLRHRIWLSTLSFFLVCSGQAAEPQLGSPDHIAGGSAVTAGQLLQVTLGLFFVVAMIIGVAWLARRYGRYSILAGGTIKALGGISIGPRERVILLQVADKQLLIGVAPGCVQTLYVLEEPLQFEQRETGSGNQFARILNAAVKSKSRP